MNRIAYVLGVNVPAILSFIFIVGVAGYGRPDIAVGGLVGVLLADKLRAADAEYKRLTEKS